MKATANDVLDHMVVLVKRGWTKFSSARDEKRRECSPDSTWAASFCLMGAHCRASIDLDATYTAQEEAKLAIYSQLRGTRSQGSITDFNDADGRTVEEVIELIMRAKS